MTSERAYWEANFATDRGRNAAFFDWFAARRLELFQMPQTLFSLEIGVGNGTFARMANVSVAADISQSALEALRSQGSSFCVVADAAALPFQDGSFDVVFVNDVMHHMKSHTGIPRVRDEIRRVLRTGGFLCVSDRLPTRYNRFILAVSGAGRLVLKMLFRLSGRRTMMSGSDDEPEMSTEDWAALKVGFDTVSCRNWRHWSVFWGYGLFQFVALVLPERHKRGLASWLVNVFDRLDRSGASAMMSDACVVLRRI